MGGRDEGEGLIEGLLAARRELVAVIGELDGEPGGRDVLPLLWAACDCIDEAVARLRPRISGSG